MNEQVSKKIESLAKRWWEPDDKDKFLAGVESAKIPSNNWVSDRLKKIEQSSETDSKKKDRLIEYFLDYESLEFYMRSLTPLPWSMYKAKTLFFVKNDIDSFSCNKSLLTAEIEERLKARQKPNEIQSFLEKIGLRFCQDVDDEEVYPLGKIKLDLRFIDFSKADFSSGIFLAGAHLEGSRLKETRFRDAMILKSHFERCDLRLSKFDGAKCPFTKFNGAVLSGASFDNSSAIKCDFSGSDLCMASFNSSDLSGAIFLLSAINGLVYDGNTKVDSDTAFTADELEVYGNNEIKYFLLYEDPISSLCLVSPLQETITSSPNCEWKDLSWLLNLAKTKENRYFRKLRSEYEDNVSHTHKNYSNLKNLFRRSGCYGEANAYLYSELKYRRKSKSKSHVGYWAEYIFEICTGYCLKPLRILFTSVIVILVFAMPIFVEINRGTVANDIGSMLFNTKKAVYFSITAFATLGYGDHQPNVDSWMSWLCSIESLFGLLLSGLFVVSMAKLILKE